MIDINLIRAHTPGCHDKIFLNSAGASLMPQSVNQKVIEYLKEEENIGGYALSDQKESELNEFYKEAAILINCLPHNISFASNASEAFAKALSTIHFRKGDIIITSDDDYVSNYINFITLRDRFGVVTKRIRNLENGDLDIRHFEEMIRDQRPTLVSITHIPTNSGLIQDIETIGQICHQKEIIYLVDACQSTGQLVVDVQKIKCDFLSTTGRKFLRGPRGTGFLYVSDRMLSLDTTPLYIELGGAEMSADISYKAIPGARRFEMWEKPYALIIGFTEAIRYANHIGLNKIEEYNLRMNTHFRKKLKGLPKVRLHDQGSRQASIITLSIADMPLKKVMAHLDKANIFYTESERSGAPIDYTKKGLDWTIRLSPHYFNTVKELDQVVEIMSKL